MVVRNRARGPPNFGIGYRQPPPSSGQDVPTPERSKILSLGIGADRHDGMWGWRMEGRPAARPDWIEGNPTVPEGGWRRSRSRRLKAHGLGENPTFRVQVKRHKTKERRRQRFPSGDDKGKPPL